MKIEINATYVWIDSRDTKHYAVPVEMFKNGNVKVLVKSGRERKWRQASFLPAQFNNYTKVVSEGDLTPAGREVEI